MFNNRTRDYSGLWKVFSWLTWGHADGCAAQWRTQDSSEDEAEEHVVMRRAAGGDNGWSSDRHWDGCAGQTASHLPVLTDWAGRGSCSPDSPKTILPVNNSEGSSEAGEPRVWLKELENTGYNCFLVHGINNYKLENERKTSLSLFILLPSVTQ